MNLNLATRKAKKIQSLIETLPPRCKEVFLLSKKEGLLYKEIGDELNISIKTVEAQISKAFSFIRKEINLKKIIKTRVLGYNPSRCILSVCNKSISSKKH